MGPFLTLLVFGALSLILSVWWRWREDRKYFESRGLPFHGHEVLRIILNTIKGVGLSEDALIKYNDTRKNGGAKIGGLVDFSQRLYLICDPTLIKHVLIKDVDHFMDRQHFQVHAQKDYLLEKMLLSQTGQKWKLMRSRMSPTFSTGKIRRLFSSFNNASEKLMVFLEGQINSKNGGDNEVDLNHAFDKFTTDVIASATCGVDSHAFDQVEPSTFQVRGKDCQLTFEGLKTIKIFFLYTFPSLAYSLGLTFLGKGNQTYFSHLFRTEIKKRVELEGKAESVNKVTNKNEDFVQLMLEMRESTKDSDNLKGKAEAAGITKKSSEYNQSVMEMFDEEGIASNCLQFILAGYEGTQSLLLFAVYALALHPTVQGKVREEIEEAKLKEENGELSFHTINNLEYLDCFLNETMRFYSTCGVSARSCTSDYVFPGTNIKIKKGEGLLIPIIGFHWDPAYFPNPGEFRPERFSKENRSSIVPNTFMPFGLGPRDCIGRRFAVIEVKVALCHLVRKFTISPSKKTLIPMEYQDGLQRKPKGGMFLGLTPRK